MSFSGANFLQRSSWDVPVRPSTLVGGSPFHWISQVSPGQQLMVPCWPAWCLASRSELVKFVDITGVLSLYNGSVPGSDGNPGFQPVFIMIFLEVYLRPVPGRYRLYMSRHVLRIAAEVHLMWSGRSLPMSFQRGLNMLFNKRRRCVRVQASCLFIDLPSGNLT